MSKIYTKFEFDWDKVWHFSGCCLISWFSAQIFKNPTHGFIITVLLGACKEAVDYFDPGHRCEVWDLIADAAGALLGAYLASLYFVQ